MRTYRGPCWYLRFGGETCIGSRLAKVTDFHGLSGAFYRRANAPSERKGKKVRCRVAHTIVTPIECCTFLRGTYYGVSYDPDKTSSSSHCMPCDRYSLIMSDSALFLCFIDRRRCSTTVLTKIEVTRGEERNICRLCRALSEKRSTLHCVVFRLARTVSSRRILDRALSK